jgi:hypothetical protein
MGECREGKGERKGRGKVEMGEGETKNDRERS